MHEHRGKPLSLSNSFASASNNNTNQGPTGLAVPIPTAAADGSENVAPKGDGF
jgi:hypothetical protein